MKSYALPNIRTDKRVSSISLHMTENIYIFQVRLHDGNQTIVHVQEVKFVRALDTVLDLPGVTSCIVKAITTFDGRFIFAPEEPTDYDMSVDRLDNNYED